MAVSRIKALAIIVANEDLDQCKSSNLKKIEKWGCFVILHQSYHKEFIH